MSLAGALALDFANQRARLFERDRAGGGRVENATLGHVGWNSGRPNGERRTPKTYTRARRVANRPSCAANASFSSG